MDKKRAKSILKQIEKVKAKLGVDRDELRELLSELEDIKDSANDAYDHLDMAVDSLSQYL